MTLQEKDDISYFCFDTLWYRLYRIHPDDLDRCAERSKRKYNSLKSVYTNNITYMGRGKLLSLLNGTKNTPNYWEMPKGKPSTPLEDPRRCAIREFVEETGISFSNINILDRIPGEYPNFTINMLNNATTYQSIYYIAMHNTTPDSPIVYSKYNDINNSEIGEIKWIGVDSLEQYNINKSNRRLLCDAIKIMQGHINGSTLSKDIKNPIHKKEEKKRRGENKGAWQYSSKG